MGMNSYATPNRTADPWPRKRLTPEEWDFVESLVLKRVIRFNRWLSEHPTRAFPALAWVQERDGHIIGFCSFHEKPESEPKIRIDTDMLPVTTISAWSADFEQRFGRHYVFTNSPWPSEQEQAPAPKKVKKPRRLPRVHHALDQMILWRQQLGKKVVA